MFPATRKKLGIFVRRLSLTRANVGVLFDFWSTEKTLWTHAMLLQLLWLLLNSFPTILLIYHNSCDPMNCSHPGSSVHGDSPGRNTRVGCHALLQGIFPTQGSNPGLPHCRRILYHLGHRRHRRSPQKKGL